jgi:tetratricopeptide (TPR) repeat protein
MSIMMLLLCLHGCATTDHEAICNDLLIKAHSFADKKDYRQAHDCLEKALTEAGNEQPAWLKARVMREIVTNYLAQDDYKSADSTAQSLIQIYNAMPEQGMSRDTRNDVTDGRSRARLMLAEAMTKQQRETEALAVLKKARDEISNDLGSIELQAEIDSRYLALLRETGKPASTTVDFEAGTMTAAESRDVRGEGFRFLNAGKLDQAITRYKEARQLAKESKSEDAFVEASVYLAYAECLAQDLGAARADLDTVWNSGYLDRVKKDVKAEFFTVRAMVAQSPAEAKQDVEKAKRLAPSMTALLLNNACAPRNINLNLKIGLLKSLTPIITKLDRLNYLVQMIRSDTADDAQPKELLEFYKSRASNTSVDLEERARCLELEGYILRTHSRSQAALPFYKEALQLRERVPAAEVANERDYNTHLAEDLIEAGNVKQGIKVAESVLTMPFKTHNDLVLIAAAHQLLAQQYYKLHVYKNALAHFDATLTMFHALSIPDPDKLIEKTRAECAELLNAQTKTPSK